MKVLRFYQKNAIPFLLKATHPGLFWEMRLGKTLTCIRTCKLYSDCYLYLIVAPFSALYSWIEDLTSEEETYFTLFGNYEKRARELEKALNSAASKNKRIWVLLNKEGNQVIPQVVGKFWDVVIIDESVIISNPQTAITQFYVKHFRKVKHRWVLCGTPAPETPLQYYTQLKFLDSKLVPEKSYYEFRFKYFEMQGYDWVITEEGQKYLSYLINKNCLVLSRRNVKMGGAKIYERHMVELPGELRKVYQKVEKEFMYQLGEHTHETIWATQNYIWMRRICGGLHPSLGLKSMHKLNDLHELLISDFKDKQIIVWCKFVDEVEMVSKILETRKFNTRKIHGQVSHTIREQHRQDFQSGKYQVAVIEADTMRFGSKWTAAEALAYFTTPESGVTREQSEDRAIDVDINDSALIVDMPCFDTIEEDILDSLLKKEANSDMIKRMVNSIQKRYQ